MKTTLDINDELLMKAKALAARERTTLTALIEEGLSLCLRKTPVARRGRLVLPVYAGRSGMAEGIDPTTNRSMFDAAGE